MILTVTYDYKPLVLTKIEHMISKHVWKLLEKKKHEFKLYFILLIDVIIKKILINHYFSNLIQQL